ncbi:MAG: hypothetical protein R3E48_20740 [Burkholderiaceae bacterium]
MKLCETFISWVIPIPPWSWIASCPTWRAASATLIFAAETARRRSPRAQLAGRCIIEAREQASNTIDFDWKAETVMSTIRCCKA